MTFKRALLGATLAAGSLVAGQAAMATTLTTSLASWQAGVTGTVTSTPNPGNYDISGFILPTTSTITLGDAGTLGLSNAAQVTASPANPFGGFPYYLSSGFSGELFIPQNAQGNQVKSETITLGGGISALGFEVAPYSSASGAPYIGFAGGPYTVTVTLANGTAQMVTLPGGNDNTGTTQSQFFGFYGGGISSLTISTSDPNGFAFGNFVDVPEPASAALLLLGVVPLLRRSRMRATVA